MRTASSKYFLDRARRVELACLVELGVFFATCVALRLVALQRRHFARCFPNRNANAMTSPTSRGSRRRAAPTLALLSLLSLLLPTATLAKAILGVDLGSLYMKVALVQRNSPLEIVTNLHSKRKTEQMVLFDMGTRFYGADANSMAARKPQKIPSLMSVMLGRDQEHPTVKVSDMLQVEVSFDVCKNSQCKNFGDPGSTSYGWHGRSFWNTSATISAKAYSIACGAENEVLQPIGDASLKAGNEMAVAERARCQTKYSEQIKSSTMRCMRSLWHSDHADQMEISRHIGNGMKLDDRRKFRWPAIWSSGVKTVMSPEMLCYSWRAADATRRDHL